MFLFKTLWGFLQVVIMGGVLALSLDYYDPKFLAYEIPTMIEDLVIVGVVGVSIFWAVIHIVGGGLLGLAASGVGDGIRMGLTLGLGLGVSRLWPYCLAWALGNVVAAGPLWHAVGLSVAAAVLLALNSVMRYFWGSVQNGAFNG